jgi:hypothetical protein
LKTGRAGEPSDEKERDKGSPVDILTLGPILFLCYINDFYSATTLFSVLFADDTTCLSKGTSLQELLTYVKEELQKIAVWFRSIKMAVNTSKSKFIVLRTHGKRINENDCVLTFNNNEPGQPEDPNLISNIDRIYSDGNEKNFINCWECYSMNICLLMTTSQICVLKFQNRSSALIEKKTL